MARGKILVAFRTDFSVYTRERKAPKPEMDGDHPGPGRRPTPIFRATFFFGAVHTRATQSIRARALPVRARLCCKFGFDESLGQFASR